MTKQKEGDGYRQVKLKGKKTGIIKYMIILDEDTP